MVVDSDDDDDCEICSICDDRTCYWKSYGVDVIAAMRKDLALEGHAERKHGIGIVASDLCRKRAYRLLVQERSVTWVQEIVSSCHSAFWTGFFLSYAMTTVGTGDLWQNRCAECVVIRRCNKRRPSSPHGHFSLVVCNSG